MRYFLPISLLIILLVESSCNKDSALHKDDINKINALEEQFVEGWFASNPRDSVLSAFEEDAVFIPHHGGDPVLGVKNLEDFFWPKDSEGIVHSFNHYPDHIDGYNRVAWIRGRFDLDYSWIINNDTTQTVNEGNYVMICRKDKLDQWKIATFIFNDPIALIK